MSLKATFSMESVALVLSSQSPPSLWQLDRISLLFPDFTIFYGLTFNFTNEENTSSFSLPTTALTFQHLLLPNLFKEFDVAKHQW